jgi:N-acetylglucosamine kinase-like BadF-type ATPase
MYLGVDGGGTKTAFALVDSDGRLRATNVTGSVSHLSAGFDPATAVLLDGVAATLRKAAIVPADVTFAFFGLPAYGEDSETTGQMDAMPSSLLDPARYRCGNDMICSWAGSLACADGISVIAGTGSMAYGEYDGRRERSGGWGELIGDEGSAYWIAREGMNLFSRMSDGRAPRGALHELVRDRFGLDVDLDLCARIYGVGANSRRAFAQFAPLVHEAALAGDAQSRAIIRRAADELVAAAAAVRSALAVPDSVEVPVSWSGGAFSGSALLVGDFRDALATQRPACRYVHPRFPPMIGASLQAARLCGVTWSDAALATLRDQSAAAKLLP